jgi:predicted secreted protein
MRIWRARRRAGSRVRVLLIGGTVAAVSASLGVWGTSAAVAAPAASAAVAAPSVSAAVCAALTGLKLPDLPGSDTATVTANHVAASGCQVGIEITDTSDPRGGQPGMIGIDLTLPDSWNGN